MTFSGSLIGTSAPDLLASTAGVDEQQAIAKRDAYGIVVSMRQQQHADEFHYGTTGTGSSYRILDSRDLPVVGLNTRAAARRPIVDYRNLVSIQL